MESNKPWKLYFIEAKSKFAHTTVYMQGYFCPMFFRGFFCFVFFCPLHQQTISSRFKFDKTQLCFWLKKKKKKNLPRLNSPTDDWGKNNTLYSLLIWNWIIYCNWCKQPIKTNTDNLCWLSLFILQIPFHLANYLHFHLMLKTLWSTAACIWLYSFISCIGNISAIYTVHTMGGDAN